MQKETHSVENIAHNSDINSLLKTLITALSTQLVAAEAELTQVKKLMDGAIEEIVDSFISLEASTRIAQNIVTQGGNQLPQGPDDGRRAELLSAGRRVALGVDAALGNRDALRGEDHAAHEGERLSQRAHRTRMRGVHAGDHAELHHALLRADAAAVRHLRSAVGRQPALLSLQPAVVQVLMSVARHALGLEVVF